MFVLLNQYISICVFFSRATNLTKRPRVLTMDNGVEFVLTRFTSPAHATPTDYLHHHLLPTHSNASYLLCFHSLSAPHISSHRVLATGRFTHCMLVSINFSCLVAHL